MSARIDNRPSPTEQLGDWLARVPRRPVEGWITVFAAAVMVTAIGASLVEAGWTRREVSGDPGFLLYVGGVGLAFGLFGAKVGWGRWRTHLVGALFGGIFLVLIMGGLVLEARGLVAGWDPFGLAARVGVGWAVVQGVWRDLAVLRVSFTVEEGHYHLVFGTLVWGAGLLAGFTIFGHRRPLDAVVVLGLVLLTNITLTQHDQLGILIMFSAAALLLLIRTHVFEEEITWARRRIGDPAAVGRLYLNGGVAFVTAAVLGSMLLTATASSAPLQGLWRDLPRHLSGLSELLQAFAPGGGAFKPIGAPTFSAKATTSGFWQPSRDIAFEAQLPAGEKAEFKWRAGAYDHFFTYGWSRSDPTTAPVTPAGSALLAGAADQPSTVGRREITITIFPDAYRDLTIVGPNSIAAVDHESVTRLLGLDGWFSTVESTGEVEPYTVTALIPVSPDTPGALTEAQLRTAGTAYPAELKTIYLQLPDDALGPEARKLLQTIKTQRKVPDGFDAENPYDLARTMERYLANPQNFQYDPNVKDERDACGAASTVECFAIIRRGYCEYYAGAMAAMLRFSGVPARVAYGFLSNPLSRGDANVEQVGGALAHWWVEVYFPGTGWVEFDPTGSVGQPVPLPSGSAGPSTPRPSQALSTRPPLPTGGVTPTSPGGNPTTGIGPFIAIGLILLVAVGALAYAAYRRTPRRPMHPDQAWGAVAGLAARFGLGPRPSQTVYEYAGALGDEVPMARVELTTIARAKVEVAYGHRDLEPDRLQRIAQAYHRLRLAIISLVVRRGLRRFRGRGRR
jgi:transglutaminase-like putative cysteine protease